MQRFQSIGLQLRALLCLAMGLAAFPALAQQFDATAAEKTTYRILSIDEKSVSSGSGFLINNDGYVVTNNHVIESAKDVFIIQKIGETIKVWKARIHAVDSSLDLAVLNAQGIIGTPVVFANKHPQKAEQVFAVGFPGQADDNDERSLFFQALKKSGFRDFPADPAYNGYVSASVKTGSIESVRERKWGSRGDTAWVITHNAPITGGNSGGPLFTLDGRFVGVNTQGRGEGKSEDGVLVGNILRQSSLYNELESFLDRLGIEHVKSSDHSSEQAASPPTIAPSELILPAANQEAVEKPAEENVIMKYLMNGRFLLVVGGCVAILALGLFVILNRRGGGTPVNSTPAPSSASVASENQRVAMHAGTDNDRLPFGRSQPSAEIVPLRSRHQVPMQVRTRFHLTSAKDSPLQVRIEIPESGAKRGFILGRSSSADYQIKHSSISREHARISTSPQGLYITDVGSSNGTFHNNQKVNPKTGMLLSSGDLIQLGDIKLLFEIENS